MLWITKKCVRNISRELLTIVLLNVVLFVATEMLFASTIVWYILLMLTQCVEHEHILTCLF